MIGDHIAFPFDEYVSESPKAVGGASGGNVLTTRELGGALSMMPQEGVELEIDPDPQLEREAEATAQRVMAGGENGV